MNKRIRELLKQSGVKSEIMIDDSSRDVECLVSIYDNGTPSIHNWEKFSKLIVEDCRVVLATVCRNTPLEQQWPLVDVDDAIAKHFGVE